MLTDIFTTREIATAVWLSIFLVWILSYRKVRASLWELIGTALHWKIVLPVALDGAYATGILVLLNKYQLWHLGLLKETILWFALTGLVLIGRAIGGTEGALKEGLVDAFKILVLFEFLVGTYTYSLPAELLLIPFLAFWGMLNAYAETKPEYANVAKLTSAGLGVFGLAILASAAWRAAQNIGDVATIETTRQILLGPMLTMAVLPPLYAIMAVARYEDLFIRVARPGSSISRALRWRLQWRLFRHLGFRPSRIAAFRSRHVWRLINVTSMDDLERILHDDRLRES